MDNSRIGAENASNGSSSLSLSPVSSLNSCTPAAVTTLPYTDVFSTPLAYTIHRDKYSFDGTETWAGTAHRSVESVCSDLISQSEKNEIEELIRDRKFIPAGRYLFASGRDFHQVNNCFLFRAEDSREGWAELQYKAAMSLMTGGGIGAVYSDIRPYGSLVKKTGGFATGPLSLMKAVNEAGRQYMQGGQRRSAIWAGLSWNHADVDEFMLCKNHSPELKAAKERDLTFPLPMELTNISTIYDRSFFDTIESGDAQAQARAKAVWRTNCFQAFSTAEPGFSINYVNARESLRNACCEVVSEDDSDKCNLGTLWMAKFSSREEFGNAVRLATLFLLCGGIYSHTPTEKIREIGDRNNRIGLGLGGMHEWLMLRRSNYEVTPELHQWLKVYRDESDKWAEVYAQRLGVNVPKGKRAIAPNGTIGIVAESTTSGEPLFCAAYKRRYYKDGRWHYQYVVDGSVKRLLARGVPLEVIERNDAYALSFEDRVRFQADVQDYIDMSISSTCNMPEWGSYENNASNVDEKAAILLKYAPRLRGFTCYPDGCRGGQPLTKVAYSKAVAQEGTIFVEEVRECINGICGV